MATTNTNSNYVIPLIDARRGNYFCAVYDNKLNIIKKDSFTTLDEITKDVDNYSLVSYGDVENTKEVNIDIIKVIDKHKNDVPINPHMLNPNYLKMTEAEENLRKNDN